jgi:hypothetical protein
MEDARARRNFEALLEKLRESGDLPGLELEPDEPTENLVGGKAVRLMRGSEQLAMALIGPARAISPSDEVVLVGDEAAKDLASRLGVEFISAEGFAGLLARLVVTGLSPPAERTMLAEAGLAKAEKLKAYFQQQMAGFAVDVRQTDSDFDTMLTSFFFHKEGTQPLGWVWCIKVPNSVLADLETNKIIEHLEHHRWKERLPEAAHGTVFVANGRGLDVIKPKSTGPDPEVKQ